MSDFPGQRLQSRRRILIPSATDHQQYGDRSSHEDTEIELRVVRKRDISNESSRAA